MQKKHLVTVSVLVPAVIMLLLGGCIPYSKGNDKIFADCDSFLAYYDSCTKFMEAMPGSRCREYETLDIPESDSQCYPLVECDWFMKRPETATRLVDCRYSPEEEPHCTLSFDVTCESFSVSDGKLMIVLRNGLDEHIKDMELKVVAEGQTLDCKDSDADRIMATGEEEVFICDGLADKGVLQFVYRDYYQGALNMKEGEIIT